MKTATAATETPLYGVRYLLSALQGSLIETASPLKKKASSFAEAAEEQEHPASAAMPLYAATRASKPLIEACFYSVGFFPVISSTFLFSRHGEACVLKNCTDPVLQPRDPAMDYYGCFFIVRRSYTEYFGYQTI